jgi:hypothetical protein
MSIETLPRGGTVKVALSTGDGRTKAAVEATGNHIGLPDEVRQMLTGKLDEVELTPRNIVVYLARRGAEAAGGSFVFAAGTNGCSFALDLPAGA